MTVFSPISHVAVPSAAIVASSLSIVTEAFSSAAVAVILFVALNVSAVYAVILGLNDGVSSNAPIASADRDAFIPPPVLPRNLQGQPCFHQ